MKNLFQHKRIIAVMLFMFSLLACEDYLEEDNRSFRDTEYYYSTAEGMEGLIAACYAYNKVWYGKLAGYDFSTAGTDIFDYGNQHRNFEHHMTFDPVKFNPEDMVSDYLWINFYKGINACNEAIEVLTNPESNPFKKDKAIKRLAEVRFLRAHYNWLLVELWGGVDLRLKPVKGVMNMANRHSIEDFYTAIFEDLNFVVENLNISDNMSENDYGRVTKDAAMAFRARLKLFRASQTGNQTLYSDAIEDAKKVINSGNYRLYENYEDVWDISNIGVNDEVIWVINYSGSTFDEIGDENFYTGTPNIYKNSSKLKKSPITYLRVGHGGHNAHLLFGMQYDILPGMTRDVKNGRPFRYYFANKYLIDAYNEDVDERFYGSFKNVWFSNNTLPDSGKYEGRFRWPIDGYDYHVDTSDPLYGKLFFEPGDTAILITKKTFPDDVMIQDDIILEPYHFNIEKGYWVFDYKRLYNDDGTVNENGTNDRNNGFELKKFADSTRSDMYDFSSIRDAYIIRISEMYLTAAEALWRTGQQASAYNDYLLPLANKRAYDGDGASLLASYDVHSGADLTMEFFLDERARELCGEQLRWFDLKRMGEDFFVKRIKKYAGNIDARKNFDKYFILRPIPQRQLDAVSNKGDFPQNPGYE